MAPAVSHTQDWASYNSYYGCEEGCTGQWYNLTSQSKAGIVWMCQEKRDRRWVQMLLNMIADNSPKISTWQRMMQAPWQALWDSMVCMAIWDNGKQTWSSPTSTQLHRVMWRSLRLIQPSKSAMGWCLTSATISRLWRTKYFLVPLYYGAHADLNVRVVVCQVWWI